MVKSKMPAIGLVALGILVAVCGVGKFSIEWEWWDFLLILSSMAFVVGLVLFLARRILQQVM